MQQYERPTTLEHQIVNLIWAGRLTRVYFTQFFDDLPFLDGRIQMVLGIRLDRVSILRQGAEVISVQAYKVFDFSFTVVWHRACQIAIANTRKGFGQSVYLFLVCDGHGFLIPQVVE